MTDHNRPFTGSRIMKNLSAYFYFKIYWTSVCPLEVFCYNFSAKREISIQRKNSTGKIYSILKDWGKNAKHSHIWSWIHCMMNYLCFFFIYLLRFCKAWKLHDHSIWIKLINLQNWEKQAGSKVFQEILISKIDKK